MIASTSNYKGEPLQLFTLVTKARIHFTVLLVMLVFAFRIPVAGFADP